MFLLLMANLLQQLKPLNLGVLGWHKSNSGSWCKLKPFFHILNVVANLRKPEIKKITRTEALVIFF
jgi:hypothetical protein